MVRPFGDGQRLVLIRGGAFNDILTCCPYGPDRERREAVFAEALTRAEAGVTVENSFDDMLHGVGSSEDEEIALSRGCHTFCVGRKAFKSATWANSLPRMLRKSNNAGPVHH